MPTIELTSSLHTVRHGQDIEEHALRTAAAAGYTVNDLIDLGVPKRRARDLVAHAAASESAILTGTLPRDPLHPKGDEIVTVVASDSGNGGARSFLDTLSGYFRLQTLRLPVPMLASWLAVDEDKAIRRLFPIAARAWVPQASTTTGERIIDALLETPEYREVWGSTPSAVFAVGAPATLREPIELGYNGVPGTRSYLVAHLVNAAPLKGTPTWSGIRGRMP